MMRLWILTCVFALTACGSDSKGNALGEIGWTFDYKDFTDSADAADPRTCDNAPASGVAEPPYDAISKVRLRLDDPEGQVPPYDIKYNCIDGIGDERVEIVGATARPYTLKLEALTAQDEVVYGYDGEIDLSQRPSTVFPMRAAAGELHFTPSYADVGASCAPNVETLRYTMYVLDDAGVPATTASVTGSTPACEDSLVTDLVIREIPVAPTPGANDNFVQTKYKLVLEAVSASGQTLYCRVNANRVVRPGNNSTTGGEMLTTGTCP